MKRVGKCWLPKIDITSCSVFGKAFKYNLKGCQYAHNLPIGSKRWHAKQGVWFSL